MAQAVKRHEQAKAAVADLKARERELDRKLDTRRKIIVGAALLACAKVNRAFHEQVCRAFQAANIRPQDRAILAEFFPSPEPGEMPPPRPPKPPGEPPSGAAPA
jgi:hypothetical protein